MAETGYNSEQVLGLMSRVRETNNNKTAVVQAKTHILSIFPHVPRCS